MQFVARNSVALYCSINMGTPYMDKYLKEAIAEYEQKIETGEDFYMDASTLMDIEEYYEKNNRKYDAERLMRFAEKLHPDNEEVLVVKAYQLKGDGKWNEAMGIIKGIANQANRDVQLFYIEWDVACSRLDKAEVRTQHNLPAVMNDKDYDWYLDLGEIYLDYGFQKRALKYLEQIPKNYQFRSRADELIAEAYFQSQNYDKSIEAANRQVDINPYDAISWTQLADIQQKCGLYQECIQSCDYALAIDDTNQRAMSLKVFATFATLNTEEGLKLCIKYAHLCPNDYSLRMYAGEQLYAQHREKEALQSLQDALRLCPPESPDHLRITTDLVYTHIMLGNDNMAEELALSLGMLGSSQCSLLTQLAAYYHEFQNDKKSVELLDKALDAPHNDMKEYTAIVEQLNEIKNFNLTSELWIKLAKQPIIQESCDIYPYIALAMYKLMQKELFLRNFQITLATRPDMVVKLFGRMFNTYVLDDILQQIKKDFKLE